MSLTRIPALLVYLNVFASGVVVMVLELTGSRLLAPVFGNSIFVWGSLIGVVLSALSAGYALGGKLADRSPTARSFATIIFSAGLLTAATPYISPMALEAIHSLQLDERFGPLLATTSILLLPTILMGMVTPFGVRLVTSSRWTVGSSSGNIYSLSTIGSIVGTFTTVFVLIPLTDVRSIILGSGLVLMAFSVPLLGKGPKVLLALLLVFSLSPLGYYTQQIAATSGDVVFSKETPYNSLAVVERDSIRTLYLNGLPHSAMNITNPTQLLYRYTRFFEAGYAATNDAERVLFVGGGGFSGPKYFLEKFPTVYVDVVELDPEVISTALTYFKVPSDERLTILNDDGRRYLDSADKVYDLIVLDAYAKTYVPFHLMTVEFFRLVSEKLDADGVVVSNLIASLYGDTSTIFWSVYKTMSSVFPRMFIYTASEVSGGLVQNLIVIACKNPQCVIDYNKLADKGLKELLEKSLWTSIPVLDDYPILTDAYSPVENMINPVTGRPYSIALEAYQAAPATLFYTGSNSLSLTIVFISLTYWFFSVALRKDN
ncbi:Polyamine aminopropyltransferase [archaeon HR01]|nr:Polyamine aminopropyltransferase [archaeon HR01]